MRKKELDERIGTRVIITLRLSWPWNKKSVVTGKLLWMNGYVVETAVDGLVKIDPEKVEAIR